MMAHFSVKNFEKFQHYKDRTPPWIKLYNDLLDDYEFACLQDASKLHLILIWLLASRSENHLPYDPEWVGRRINASETVDLAALQQAGFIILDQPLHNAEQVASTALADRKQSARPERETERERDKGSDPNGSGAASAPVEIQDIPLWMKRPDGGDWAKLLFGAGREWLAKAVDKPPEKLRGLLGRWLQATGQDHKAIFQLLAKCDQDGISDPVAYITAAISDRPKPRSAPAGRFHAEAV